MVRASEDVPNDLLDDPCFRARGESGDSCRTLPELLTVYARGTPCELRHLRPHQSHAWHAFVVQLGALVANRRGEMPASADGWRAGLLALTEGRREPWQLVVDDWSKPAFMQPATSDGTKTFKRLVETPDALDLLVMSKDLDVKGGRVPASSAEAWVFALVTTQTGDGYGGVGNYGVTRMNGGYANRSDVSYAAGASTSARFAREVKKWLGVRSRLIETHGYSKRGRALLWDVKWDGEKEPLELRELDPFFVEVCRRYRLERPAPAALRARFATSKGSLVAGPDKGFTGDLWAPVRKKDAAALSMPPSGPTYARLVDWVLDGGDWTPSPSLVRGEGEDLLIARSLVRGQGTTDGWHERVVRIPERVVGFWEDETFQSRLGELAEHQVRTAGDLRRKALRPALGALLGDRVDSRIDGDVARYEARVDQEFFPRLFSGATEDHDDEGGAELAWERWLHGLGREVVERAVERLPVPDARRYAQIAEAERIYEGAARRVLDHFRGAESLARAERAQRSEAKPTEGASA